MNIVKFFPGSESKELLSVLESNKLTHLTGKIIKQTKSHAEIVVCMPKGSGAQNVLVVVPKKAEEGQDRFEKI